MTAPRGYMLLDLVVSAAITCTVAAVLFQFALAAQAAVAVQGDAGDAQQRLRVALESLRHDLAIAGAGPSRGTGRGPLIGVFAPVLPARIGVLNADPELTARTDRISIISVPDTRAQTALLTAMPTPSSPLAIDGSAPGCVPGTACDFAAGDRAVIYGPSGSGRVYELFTVASVDAARGILTPAAALARAYGAEARVAVVTVRSYYIDRAGKRLMLYDGDRSDMPLVDHIVDLHVAYVADPRPDAVPGMLLDDLGGTAPKVLTEAQLTDGPFCGESPNRFDADLLRVRGVRITLRLETESTTGPVRSFEATIEVTPANIAAR